MSRKQIAGGVGAALVLVALGVAAAIGLKPERASAASQRIEQPIVFNHKAHKDADIECGYCHSGVTTLEGAGMPRIQDCADCHAGMDNDGKEGAKIFPFAEKGEEPHWQALFVNGHWNRFSHK